MEDFVYGILSRTMVSHFVLFFQTHIFLVESISYEPSFSKDYIKYCPAFYLLLYTASPSVDSTFRTYPLKIIILGMFREFPLIQS